VDKFVIDTHVHFYDVFSAVGFLSSAHRNLRNICPEAERGIVMVDRLKNPTRSDLLLALKKELPNAVIEDHDEVVLFKYNEEKLWIFAGAQRVSTERLEVLSLFNGDVTSKALSTVELLEEVIGTNGLGVLPWSPGKWTGKRRKVLHTTCDHFSLSEPSIFLGDITQRPNFLPPLLKQAQAWNACGVLAGSDPLPLKQDVNTIGSYAVICEVPENKGGTEISTAVQNLKKALSGKLGDGRVTIVGNRNTTFKAAQRWVSYNLSSG
jgi:hypothetical protein